MADPASNNERLRWSWGPLARNDLIARYKTGLLLFLRRAERLAEAGADVPVTDLVKAADTLQEAARLLDECAANCHAMAGTMRHLAGQDDDQIHASLPAHLADRTAASIGAPVVLTRTTIEQLQGRTLVLAAVEGENAIVRDREEYWGTPFDRILIVHPASLETVASQLGREGADDSTDASRKLAVALSPKTRAFFDAFEQNGTLPVMISASATGDLVRLQYLPEGIDEFVAASHLPDQIRDMLPQHDAGLHAGSQEAPLSFSPATEETAATMYFELGTADLSNAIQFLTMTSHEGALVISFQEAPHSACLYLRQSRVIHAEFSDFTGIEAVAYMLTIPHAQARFFHGEKPAVETVALTTDQLLIEAAVRADEIIGRHLTEGNEHEVLNSGTEPA